MTVNELVEKVKSSQGFIIFVSYLEKKEDGSIAIEHRYMRNTFIPEDLEKSFENFKEMVTRDMSESGANLLRSAEAITDATFTAVPKDPLEAIDGT